MHRHLRQFKGAIERSGTEIVAIERFDICAEVSPGQYQGSSLLVIDMDRNVIIEEVPTGRGPQEVFVSEDGPTPDAGLAVSPDTNRPPTTAEGDGHSKSIHVVLDRTSL